MPSSLATALIVVSSTPAGGVIFKENGAVGTDRLPFTRAELLIATRVVPRARSKVSALGLTGLAKAVLMSGGEEKYSLNAVLPVASSLSAIPLSKFSISEGMSTGT